MDEVFDPSELTVGVSRFGLYPAVPMKAARLAQLTQERDGTGDEIRTRESLLGKTTIEPERLNQERCRRSAPSVPTLNW